jgi:hypothetical protein
VHIIACRARGRGVLLEEEMGEQEVTGGPQGPGCEELNPTLEQGKPWCI